MPLDRDQARHVLLEALPADPKWSVWVDGILDRLEPCVTPRLAEIDARLVGDAEARLARVRALCDDVEYGAAVAYGDQSIPDWVGEVRQILDARP